jgi:ABC-2 type transport system ATP-binding protein
LKIMTDEVIIRTLGLTKDFKTLRAVNDLNLEVKKGQTYGFLGPNGAGKSTTIRMLTGFMTPTAGSIELMGMDMLKNPCSVRERMGIVPDQFGFYPLMTADEHLKFYGDLYGMNPKDRDDNIDKLIPMVGLDERREAKLGEYSHGMKQRLAIAQALLNDPDLLFLDEPTTGLDPQGSYETRQLIKKLSQGGLTIFVSSHILPEIQEIASHVGIINRGILIKQDTIDNIMAATSQTGGVIIMVQVAKPGDLSTVLKDRDWVLGVQAVDSHGFRVSVTDRGRIPELSKMVANSEFGLFSIYEMQATLEQVFLDLTRGEAQ